MARRNRNMVMLTFYVGRDAKADIDVIAESSGVVRADVLREVIDLGLTVKRRQARRIARQ